MTSRPRDKVDAKLSQRGSLTRSRNIFLEFWYPLYISGTAEATNMKFGTQADRMECNAINAKLGQRGR